MNKRIKELSKQAHEYVAFSNATNLRNVFEKKFAELIIKETLQVARAGIEFGTNMEDAVYTYFGK